MARPYRLLYYGRDGDATWDSPANISKYVISIDKFTDVGTGEIVSAKLILNSVYGKFVTDTRNGKTPIIRQYDTLRLDVFDNLDDATNEPFRTHRHWRFLVVDDRLPVRNAKGNRMTLELFGRERYLQKMPYPGRQFWISMAEVARRFVRFYNANKGTEQPSIDVSILGPDIEASFALFEFHEETYIYDALMDVVGRLSLPVSAGGASEFYGLRFEDNHPASINTAPGGMTLYMLPQGVHPRIPLSTPLHLPGTGRPFPISELRKPLEGNVVKVMGQSGSGTMPTAFADWRGYVEEFLNVPIWRDDVLYRDGAYVRAADGNVHQSNGDQAADGVDPSNPLNSVVWPVRSLTDYVGSDTFQYSPWTKDKLSVIKNFGSGKSAEGNGSTKFRIQTPKPGQSETDALAFYDSNLVIRDVHAWRDWVDFRVNALSDIPGTYLYPETDTTGTSEERIHRRTYFGMRLLVDGSGTGMLSGSDKLGTAYANGLVMQDLDGDWIVLKSAEQFDECAVLYEGRIYSYNTVLGGTLMEPEIPVTETTSGLSWRDVSGVAYGNDCFHQPVSMEYAESLIGSTLLPSDHEILQDSAIKITYRVAATIALFSTAETLVWTILGASGHLANMFASLFSGGTKKVLDATQKNIVFNSNRAAQTGWWATLWEAPFPKSTNHGIGEDVGDLYGKDRYPILDLLNLNRTPSGKTGYGYQDSDNLGPLDGIEFFFNFDITGINIHAWRGNLPFRATIYDAFSNVWIADVSYRLQKVTQLFKIPFSQFKIYRARIQPAFEAHEVITRIINPERRITEILDRRFIKRITFQCMIAYDDDGRFDPYSWLAVLNNVAQRITGTFTLDDNINFVGVYDAFCFTKTPIAIEMHDAEAGKKFLMAPSKKFTQISNTRQLQKIARSELDIALHRADIFTIKLTNDARAKAESTAVIQDDDLIEEQGDDKTSTTVPNTRPLIIKKVTHSVNARGQNSGFLSTVELFKRVGDSQVE